MPKHHKPHLHTYLDRGNIFDIYKLWNDGGTEESICEMYGFSSQSLLRILSVHKWKKHQRKTWGYSNPPTLTREMHPVPHPFQKVAKVASVPGEGSKFTPNPADPDDFCDKKPDDSIEKIYTPMEELGKQLDSQSMPSIPELDHVSAALERKLNQHEVEHRIEAVQICFSMLQEEFTKLKVLIRD